MVKMEDFAENVVTLTTFPNPVLMRTEVLTDVVSLPVPTAQDRYKDHGFIIVLREIQCNLIL